MEKGVADTWLIKAIDATSGAGVTGIGGAITNTLYKDGSTSGVSTTDVNPTELSGGFYQFNLTTAENDVTNHQLLIPAHSSAIVVAYPNVRYPRPINFNMTGIETDGDLTKVNTLNGHTPQTGDTFAQLPANFSISVISTSGVANSNVKLISDDAVAADNLELQYDGTGLSGNTFPATQIQASDVLTDTNELQTNQGNWLTATGFATAVKQDTMEITLNDVPTTAEFNARTIPSADYIVVGDTLARVTLVDTVTSNTDLVTAAEIVTAMEADNTLLDYLATDLIYKKSITIATGDSIQYNKTDTLIGTIAGSYADDGTTVFRKNQTQVKV